MSSTAVVPTPTVPRYVLIFSSVMHIWSDLFFALLVPLLPAIKDDLGLSYAEVGLLRSVFTGATAVFQIPVGILAETTGEFWLLLLGNAWVSIGLMAMALCTVFPLLLVVSFVGGLGGGTQHPLGSSMVSRAYDEKGVSKAVGTVNFSGDLGKMVAPAFALLAIPFGWRATLLITGITALIFMIFCAPFKKAVDMGRPDPVVKDAVSSDGVGRTNMAGFVTLSGIGVLDSATRSSALVFLPFIMHAKGMEPAHISIMLVVLFGGGAVGKYVVGWLGDKFTAVSLIWATKGLTAVLLIASLFAPPIALIPILAIMGIGLNGTSSALYATVASLVPLHRRARLYGFFYTTNEIGTILAPLVYGFIADIYNLDFTVIVMGVATLVILPASLALRRHIGYLN